MTHANDDLAGGEAGILQLIELARAEDLGPDDVTTALLADAEEPASFRLVAKQPGVFAGRQIAPMVLKTYDPGIGIEWATSADDGTRIEATPTVLATLGGPLGSILSAERVLLNFLQRLSGVATLTRAFVDAVAGTGAEILDTRKTTPGWRTLDKYAVRCGGGRNHRVGLFDAVLIKDNHVVGTDRSRMAAEVFDMLNRLGDADARPAFVEVEAKSLDEVEQLLKVVGVDVILLDNFGIEDMRRAVATRAACGLEGKVQLEASGGITLDNVRAVAETGVERISVGALTHSAPALDLSLERAAS